MGERTTILRLGLPKGRMQGNVTTLLVDSGIPVGLDERQYRPRVGNGRTSVSAARATAYEAKLLKPQNVVEMLAAGSRDIGFAGADWVKELDAELVELLDTGLDPVKIVVSAPEDLVRSLGAPPIPAARWKEACGRTPRIASEYENITRTWLGVNVPGARFIRSYGATEVFPPEDADLIVDNCATGSTLKANQLEIVDTIMESSTRLYASKEAMADPEKREAALSLVLLLRSVLEARRRVMLEINVSSEVMRSVVEILPCLRAPTLSPLQDGTAFAVKVAAPREQLAELLPEIKRRGGTDIVVTELCQLVP